MASADATPAEQQPHPRRVADDLSLRLYHLTNIAKLAAFACEARRVLEGVSEVVHFRDEMRETLSEGIDAMNTWREMEDPTGEVLRHLANGLAAVNEEWTDVTYRATPAEGSAQ